VAVAAAAVAAAASAGQQGLWLRGTQELLAAVLLVMAVATVLLAVPMALLTEDRLAVVRVLLMTLGVGMGVVVG
jgi:hypothetical protein